jgi:hypothetical protein
MSSLADNLTRLWGELPQPRPNSAPCTDRRGAKSPESLVGEGPITPLTEHVLVEDVAETVAHQLELIVQPAREVTPDPEVDSDGKFQRCEGRSYLSPPRF